MRIVAFYLPQFHEIPENSEWWGEGFTEWTNVKKARSLFKGHEQPRIPLNNNYYDLLDEGTLKWQVQIAKQHGIYGFCYYHYWFDGKLLLEQPVERMLENQDVDMPFCLSWANEAWTRAWTGGKEVLIEQRYGGAREWKEHFEYLLPFFEDERYIKVDGNPLFVIYRPEVIPHLSEMLECWRCWAKEAGFPGLTLAFQQVMSEFTAGDIGKHFDWDIEFQPLYTDYFGESEKNKRIKQTWFWKRLRTIKRTLFSIYERFSGSDLDRQFILDQYEVRIEDYDRVWHDILTMDPVRPNSVPGAYVGWDNTPRYGRHGIVHAGATPDKFRNYMIAQIERARNVYQSDYIFLTAWNEWAEGSVMEPDTRYEYGFLEALKAALERTEEMPMQFDSSVLGDEFDPQR